MVIPTTISAYEPLSEEEAAAWWSTISREERLQFIIDYDYVEHATPEMDPPAYTAVLTDDDVILIPDGPLSLTIGHLSYSVAIEEVRYEDIIPPCAPCPNRFWKNYGWGVLSGAVLTVAIGVTTLLLVR